MLYLLISLTNPVNAMWLDALILLRLIENLLPQGEHESFKEDMRSFKEYRKGTCQAAVWKNRGNLQAHSFRHMIRPHY